MGLENGWGKDGLGRWKDEDRKMERWKDRKMRGEGEGIRTMGLGDVRRQDT